MIEDLQDEIQNEQPQKSKKTHRKGWFLFLAFIVWVIYAAIMILAFLPSMIRAVRQSDIVHIIENRDELRYAAQTREAKLCFAIPKSDGSSTYVLCNQRIGKTGASVYHDVMEGLLEGPGPEALAVGAISFIENGTSLIGLTVSANTAFVNLSSGFTSSGSSWGPNGLDTAIKQITKTLQAADASIRNVIILVDGEELTV